VDYETFRDMFWPKLRIRKKKLSAQVVWTEIFSGIKGTRIQGSSNRWMIPRLKEHYMKYASPFLTKEEKRIVFNIYEQYEEWRNQMGAYDLLDIANHIEGQFLR